MIYLSVSTYNRFWHFALTMLSLARCQRPAGLYVEVIDDGSDDQHAEAKRLLVRDLLDRQIVSYYKRRRPEPAASPMARYNAIFDYALGQASRDIVSHWFHLDDDLCLSPDVLLRMLADYDRYLRRGVLFGFLNAWQRYLRRHCNGPLWHVHELGGCMFLASRSTAAAIRDVFATPEQRAARHENMWAELRRLRETLAIRRGEPYGCQHTANADTALHGYKPQWRDGWGREPESDQLIEIPPFDLAELRRAVDGGQLEAFVRRENERGTVKVLLPS